MAQELVIQNAVYSPEQKRLEIVIALVEFQLLDIVTTVTDKASGQQVSQVTETQKNGVKSFGETLYCPDAAGHVHDPKACSLAHPDYATKKTVLAGRMADFKAKAPPVSMTPADRKLE